MKHYIWKFVKIFMATIVIFAIAGAVAFGGAVLGYWGNVDDIDVDTLTLNQNSVIVYIDPDTGEEKELQKIDSPENREWVDIEHIPDAMQKAFIAIEDERFMEHKGYDLPRTVKATLTWVGNKITGKTGVSLGGSTITQQLIKNVTGEKEQTPIRKIKEISRAVSIEKKLNKSEILELYLNCIYLSNGCNGVQTAAHKYFNKDVSELDLAECASIAGITQNPEGYDPTVNPENNKNRRKTVLGKMLELGYISQSDYDAAANEELRIASSDDADSVKTSTNSYFVDQVLYDVMNDLQQLGYSQALASKILYSGGVKVYAAYNPEIQKIVEDYYAKESNFAGKGAQSAITVMDVQTGQVVGIAGGIGEKSGSLVMNRASQTPRQPGSTMKPIAAYAPALENNLITPGSIYNDKATSYNGWTPRNYDYKYNGEVDVRYAVRRSLNTVPVQIINDMGVQTSYDFLTQKLHLTTLVESEEINGSTYTDMGLSQLALGGLTHGATTLEMAAAYAPFANGGFYNTPYTYTEVKDKDGNVILSSTHSGERVMKESTAFVMTEMLKEVVSSGTGTGASVSGVNYTAGKTGTTSENNDRWFIGYTPYYVAAIWYGYDIPKEITTGSNPCTPVFRNIMNSIHRTLPSRDRKLTRPDDVVSVSYCTYTGKRATSSCPSQTFYFPSDNVPGYCGVRHAAYSEPEEDDDDDDGDNDDNRSSGTSGSSSANGTSGSSGTSSGGSSGSSGTSSGSSGSSSGGSSGSSSGASANPSGGSGTAGGELEE